MNSFNQIASTGSAGSSAISRNTVLRNTYWLLALSLVPTVLGAWAGIAFNLRSMMVGSPFIAFGIFMVVSLGFFFVIEKFKHSATGVALLLAFTFFMGLWLSMLISRTLGFSNGPQLIMTAFGGTALIFGVMATIATVSKRDFSGIGKWAFVGMLVIIIAAVANIWLKMPALSLTISVLAIMIFSAYMLYDVQRVVNGGETNYISATLAIYLDIYNVFSSLLQLLGIFGGEKD
jgi:modulator of FtsH protease